MKKNRYCGACRKSFDKPEELNEHLKICPLTANFKIDVRSFNDELEEAVKHIERIWEKKKPANFGKTSTGFPMPEKVLKPYRSLISKAIKAERQITNKTEK